MRTKDITDCFGIGWLAGFSITIRIIRCWCVPITDTGAGAWPIRTAAGWAAGGSLSAKPGRLLPPPTPGWRKNRGRVPGRVGYISQPFKTTSSKQGVQEKQGGMIFEQVCEK